MVTGTSRVGWRWPTRVPWLAKWREQEKTKTERGQKVPGKRGEVLWARGNLDSRRGPRTGGGDLPLVYPSVPSPLGLIDM